MTNMQFYDNYFLSVSKTSKAESRAGCVSPESISMKNSKLENMSFFLGYIFDMFGIKWEYGTKHEQF